MLEVADARAELFASREHTGPLRPHEWQVLRRVAERHGVEWRVVPFAEYDPEHARQIDAKGLAHTYANLGVSNLGDTVYLNEETTNA